MIMFKIYDIFTVLFTSDFRIRIDSPNNEKLLGVVLVNIAFTVSFRDSSKKAEID